MSVRKNLDFSHLKTEQSEAARLPNRQKYRPNERKNLLRVSFPPVDSNHSKIGFFECKKKVLRKHGKRFWAFSLLEFGF